MCHTVGRITILVVFVWLASYVVAQPTLTPASVVEFEDNALGTVVAANNGTMHLVRIISKQQDADTPLLDEMMVRFPMGGSANATLVRRIPVDDRYIIGLYRCMGAGGVLGSHRITAVRPTPNEELYIVLDKRPMDEPVFEPETRGRVSFDKVFLDYYELNVSRSAFGLGSSPVYTADGSVVAITMESWKRSDDRTVVNMLPIARIRELIVDKAGAGNVARVASCEEFDLRDAATGRNTCEAAADALAAGERLRVAQEEKHQQEVTRYNAQRKDLKRWERRMVQQSFAWAPFVAWARNTDFTYVPLGFDFYAMPDRFFQLHVKVQGGPVIGHHKVEEELITLLGYDRIHSNSYFAEGLGGFCLGKGDIFVGATAGYGMETPATLRRTGNGVDLTTKATANWLRPVSQFDIGIQIANVRLLLGFRTAHGGVPDIYKAQNLILPLSTTYVSGKNLFANKTMILFELVYRIGGWWNTDMKNHARDEYNAGGGLPSPN